MKSDYIESLTMKAGEGEHSYASNSLFQLRVMEKGKQVLAEAVRLMLKSLSSSPTCFKVADLGSSTGPNVFPVICEITSIVDEIYQQREEDVIPEFEFCLNDLPQNDFNTMFKLVLRDMKKLGETRGICCVSGVPGSFYSRLFPSNSLHFVHSCYSLHFLSKVPEGLDENKGNIYMGSSSPKSVYSAYWKQFERDFREFLRLRSREMVKGGCMVLSFIGRRMADPSQIESCHFWVILNASFLDLVAEGLVRESDLDSFNMPFYNPSEDEVKEIIKTEGSFAITTFETFERQQLCNNLNGSLGTDNPVIFEADVIRAVTEPMLAFHFGEQIIEPLFQRYAKNRADHVCSAQTNTTVDMVLSLIKK